MEHEKISYSPLLVKYDSKHDMYIPCTAYGANLVLTREETLELIEGLARFCNSVSNDTIRAENHKRDMLFRRKRLNREKEHSEYIKGYIYILKCEDKYKIGFSKNVERRMKQLDTRPFNLELVFKFYSDIAYDIEHTLHTVYEKYKLDGEWYSSELPVYSIIEKFMIYGDEPYKLPEEEVRDIIEATEYL